MEIFNFIQITEEIDNFRFSDVLNIAQITTNLKIEWDEIKSLIP